MSGPARPHTENSVAEWLTESELMKWLGISRTTLWRLRATGLPHISVGRALRYNRLGVQEWMRQRDTKELAAASRDNGHRLVKERTYAPTDEIVPDELLPCHWSLSVALDPKHRPQLLTRPASTVRREWWRFPQEAHLLDVAGWRYRRLVASEIGVLQGFEPSWATNAGLGQLDQIRGYGDAVPPQLAEVVFRTLQNHLDSPLRTSVELCAGFGGLAHGKSQALEVAHVALVEWWAEACRVLRANGSWDRTVVHQADVRQFDWATLSGAVDLLSGGPPCQPWSASGSGMGAADERDLLGYMPDLVGMLKPAAFVFENVPGLLTGENYSYAEWLVRRLREPSSGLSYGVAAGVLNAADYGVPQVRRRVFIVGIRGADSGVIHRVFDAIYSLRTHADPTRPIPQGLGPWKTIDQALPDARLVRNGWRRWVEGAYSEQPLGEYLTDGL